MVIGSRGSDLAMWQSRQLEQKLKDLGLITEIKVIKTKGDKVQNLGFDKMEGKGFFTKEIEESLLSRSCDIAVHSLKDVGTDQPDGLVLCGLSEREDPRDILIIHPDAVDKDMTLQLKNNAVVGTSSIRRKVQIKALLDHVTLQDLRGNVPTRINKLREGQYDAIILAYAGVKRLSLDLSDLTVIPMHPHEFVPAPGQGVVTYQCRESDIELRRIMKKIYAGDLHFQTNIERGVMQKIGGGCHLPLGVYCEKDALGNFHVHACYKIDDETELKRTFVSQSTSVGLIDRVAHDLLT
ncbi:MAG: hydroxymethylbilane synthase [Saprospiraceae bacterium]|nr:hydroxymethylbilane synthase [Saprospiraceae bacterium]